MVTCLQIHQRLRKKKYKLLRGHSIAFFGMYCSFLFWKNNFWLSFQYILPPKHLANIYKQSLTIFSFERKFQANTKAILQDTSVIATLSQHLIYGIFMYSFHKTKKTKQHLHFSFYFSQMFCFIVTIKITSIWWENIFTNNT